MIRDNRITGGQGKSGSTRRATRLALAARWLFVLGAAVASAGCGGSNETLDSFKQRWYAAVNSRQTEGLFDMLDLGSQRRLREDLERLRGLKPELQQSVIDQLGGERKQSLIELSPQRYFALLWHQLTEGRPPGMTIEAAGTDSAYMVLTLDGGRRQRIRLIVEGGRWTWSLPEQEVSVNTTAAAPRK